MNKRQGLLFFSLAFLSACASTDFGERNSEFSHYAPLPIKKPSDSDLPKPSREEINFLRNQLTIIENANFPLLNSRNDLSASIRQRKKEFRETQKWLIENELGFAKN